MSQSDLNSEGREQVDRGEDAVPVTFDVLPGDDSLRRADHSSLEADDLGPSEVATPEAASLQRRDHPWVCTGPEGLIGGGLWHRLRSQVPLLRIWIGREFSARYRQSVLDVVWSLVQPVATLAIYGSVLIGAFGVTGDGLPYLSFAWAGLTAWTFLSNALAMAVPSIGYDGAISKTYFPREVIPLAVIGTALVDLGIQTVILCGLAVFQGIGLSVHLVALAAVDLVLVLWVAAIGVFGAAVSVFIRDVRHITGLALRLGFFASPIMYPITQYPERFGWVVNVNPVAVVSEGMRDVVLRHTWPEWSVLAVHGALAGTLLVLALLYTRSVEPRMVDLT